MLPSVSPSRPVPARRIYTGLHGQTLSPLLAAALEHQAAATRFHAGPEPVVAFAFDI